MALVNPLSSTIPTRQPLAVVVTILAAAVGALIGHAGLTIVLLVCCGALNVWAFNDRTFSDPVAVFVLFFVPYSVWHGLHQIAIGQSAAPGLVEALNLSMVGLCAYVFVGAAFRFFAKPVPRSNLAAGPRSLGLASRMVVLAGCALVAVAILQVVSLGLTTKREILDYGLRSAEMAGLAAFVIAAGALLAGWRSYARRGLFAALGNPVLIVGVVALAAMMLVIGERDAVFRFGFAAVVIYCVLTRRSRTSAMFVLLALVVLSIPITQSAKGILVGGAPQPIDLDALFTGEFISALRNTQMLVMHGVDHSLEYIRNDVLRALTPLVRARDVASTTAWYHNVYRVENGFAGTSGWGLGYVAQGYLVGGWLGVVALMAFISAVMHALRVNAMKSDLWLVFYAFALATAIYCIRADLANFLSQTFKIGGAAVLVMWAARIADRSIIRFLWPEWSPLKTPALSSGPGTPDR